VIHASANEPKTKKAEKASPYQRKNSPVIQGCKKLNKANLHNKKPRTYEMM